MTRRHFFGPCAAPYLARLEPPPVIRVWSQLDGARVAKTVRHVRQHVRDVQVATDTLALLHGWEMIVPEGMYGRHHV